MLWSTNLKEIGLMLICVIPLHKQLHFQLILRPIQEKRDNTLNQVNASVELLEHLFDSTVLPQSFDDKCALCTFLQSSLKVFNKLFKNNIWPMN